jgi:integrase
MTGKEILESKKNDKDFLWERKTVEFKAWMKTNDFSDNSTRIGINTLRSFFDFYRTPLVLSQQEKRRVNGKAQRVTRDYMLTNDDLSKMFIVGDLREKYLVLLGKSFGLRAGDFISLTYGTFRSISLETEPPIFIGEFQTQKEGIIAFPFIDSDALPILKAVLNANQDKPDNQRIITVDDEELSTILQRLARKAPITLGDKNLRFHCLRKYLIDRLSANTSESKWKQIVGKSISEEAYVSSFELREAYSKTMKLTTINTNGNAKVSKLSEEIDELKIKDGTKERIINSLVQDSTRKDLEIEKLKQQNASVTEKVEFFFKFVNLADAVETKDDAQRVLDFFEKIRWEKEVKARVEQDKKEWAYKSQIK